MRMSLEAMMKKRPLSLDAPPHLELRRHESIIYTPYSFSKDVIFCAGCHDPFVVLTNPSINISAEYVFIQSLSLLLDQPAGTCYSADCF